MPGLVVRTVQTTFRPGQRLDARECNQTRAARTSREPRSAASSSTHPEAPLRQR